MLSPRYERNIPSISEKEQTLLFGKKVLVIGCGGLGGYILESLARLGIGHIIAVDGDVFEESNLNRQLYSAPDLIGQNKADAAARRVQTIAPDVNISPVKCFFDRNNAARLIAGQDLVIDALDNVSSRLIMEDVCEKQNVTFVHGAITGWNMQVTVGYPGQKVLHRIYGNGTDRIPFDAKKACKTSLPMTPAVCAAIQISEAVKLLTGQKPSLDGKILLFNLKTMEQIIIPFNNGM